MNQIAQYLAKGGASCKTESQSQLSNEAPAVLTTQPGSRRGGCLMVIPETGRPAIFAEVRKAWAFPGRNPKIVGRPRTLAGKIAVILGISVDHPAKRIRNYRLDRHQSEDAFWINYNAMVRNAGEKMQWPNKGN